jgi:hypothetical protein
MLESAIIREQGLKERSTSHGILLSWPKNERFFHVIDHLILGFIYQISDMLYYIHEISRCLYLNK